MRSPGPGGAPLVALDAAFGFALTSAVCFASADMFARFGLQRANTFVGATIILVGELLLLALLLPFLDLEFPSWRIEHLWVMAAGAFNPGLFMIFYMIGIHKIGVARASPIKGSSPLFGALLAIPILGERPEWYHLLGVALVAAGIALVSSGKTEGRWRRVDALWPIGAALMSGFAAISWRRGLAGFPDVLAASFIGVASALLLVGLYTAWTLRGKDPGDVRGALPAFLACGLAAGSGVFLYAHALQRGEVYRVLPFVQMAPLFTVLLALIFLRRAERITWRIPAGAILTVGGALLVTLQLGPD